MKHDSAYYERNAEGALETAAEFHDDEIAGETYWQAIAQVWATLAVAAATLEAAAPREFNVTVNDGGKVDVEQLRKTLDELKRLGRA